MTNTMKSIFISFTSLVPALLLWGYWSENRTATLPYPELVAYGVLTWAALDFIIVLGIEQERRTLSQMTIPSFLAAICTVLLFAMTEGVNHFVSHLSYKNLTPFVLATAAMISVAIFREKRISLKAFLGLNMLMLAFLWEMGSIDKVMMPF